ncbi:MAG TPA: hypothetical protein VJ805_05080 [Nitrospiraceae bacterium]|nr:hypothetical protein [Nitrospiraceae bacterium]
MNWKHTQPIVFAAIAAAALVGFTGSPASAKSQKKASRPSAASAAASLRSAAPAVAPAPKPGQHDTKPGPAWRTVGGTVKGVQGDLYTVEDYEGNQVRLHVGQGTKHLGGNKKIGDSIRAEITRGGFANSIQ